MIFDKYQTAIPGWGTAVEAMAQGAVDSGGANYPFLDVNLIRVPVEEDPKLIVAVASLPNGARPPWLDAQLSINTGNQTFSVPINDDHQFVDERRSLIILNQPGILGKQELQVTVQSSGQFPIAVNVMAFHGSATGGLHSGPSFKCRACKSVAKALALAIVAAATLPALPAALLSAVAVYLGASMLVATVFISSVIGDTADVIAEKLCKKAGFC
jgi:hypothetical protein